MKKKKNKFKNLSFKARMKEANIVLDFPQPSQQGKTRHENRNYKGYKPNRTIERQAEVLKAKRERERARKANADEIGVPPTVYKEGAMRGRRNGTPFKVNWENVEKLLAIQCTASECAGFLKMSTTTLYNACKRDKRMPWSEYARDKMAGGRASLRRTQWIQAEKSTPMAIFLGKQYLSQSDKVDQVIHNTNMQVDWDKLGDDDLDALEHILSKTEVIMPKG